MKVLFFDTESTDLAASWGRILCASFADLTGEVRTMRGDLKPFKGRTAVDDSRLAAAIRDELESADFIVGWNSILHDIPLLNARLKLGGERPVEVGVKYSSAHLDLMWYSGGTSMKIGGRSLATVSRFFDVDNEKTALDGTTWQLAATGDKVANDLVAEHCEADVLVLRDLWPILAPMVKKFQFTLSEVWPFIDKIESRRK